MSAAFWIRSGLVLILTLAWIPLLTADQAADPPFEAIEWRTWTSPEGAEIVGALTGIRPDGAVIVRRDGREFVTPFARFSEADRQYIADWAAENLPGPEMLQEVESRYYALPDAHEIDNVEHQRAEGSDPLEVAALQMVLDFHGIQYGEALAEQLRAREIYRDEWIPQHDLINVLEPLPVEVELVTGGDPYSAEAEDAWEQTVNTLRLAISINLPVIVGYRPELELETSERTGVATGYDRQNLLVLEPTGSRTPTAYHWDDFQYMFSHAMILFPTYEPALLPVEALQPPAEFLNLISSTIRQLPQHDPVLLTNLLRELGMEATISDVNRTDYRTMLGQTRSFAREGGLPMIEASLDRGRVVVIPQEYEDVSGFALVYGRAEDVYAVVDFFPDNSFRRGPVEPADLARRWITREDRSYRLDLIQVVVPPENEVYAAPPADRAPLPAIDHPARAPVQNPQPPSSPDVPDEPDTPDRPEPQPES